METLGQHPGNAYTLLSRGAGQETETEPISPAFRELWGSARAVADREDFLHWEAAFPGVWHGWQNVHPQGGFDAVIGNPPWDRTKLQEVEWFATRAPEIALASTAAARRAGILAACVTTEPGPWQTSYDAAKERADRFGQLVRDIGALPAVRAAAT